MQHRRIWLALGAILTLTSIAAFAVLWQAARALGTAEERTRGEGRFDFSDRVLDPAIPAGFDTIAAPNGFRDAAVFGGRVFIGGGAGVSEYDSEGRLVNRFRPGLELPAAPVAALAAGASELWIATAGEGALAFDGSRFRHIRAGSAPHRKLTAILPLSTGRTLFGTDRAGVLVFDGETLGPLHPSLGELRVTALAGDEASLWIGTQDAGLAHWHAGQLDRYGEAEGLPDPRVFAIAADESGAYAATALGVAEIRGGRVTRVLARGYTVRAVLPAGGDLLAGTLDEGLLRVPLAGRGRPGGVESSGCADCTVVRLLAAGEGVLALTEDNLYRLGQRRTEWAPLLVREEAALADRNISALAPAADGRLWIGYFDRGLDIYAPGDQHAEHIEDDVVFCVNRIVHDAEHGRVAVATANGLALFNSAATRRQVLTRDRGLIASHVTDVLALPDGTLIAGTPAGVSFIEASRISSIYAFHGLVNNHVYALGQVGNRTLVGTLGGLSVVEPGLAPARYTTANSRFKHNWITAVLAAEPDVFIGTYGGGIMHQAADGTWQPFADLPRSFEVNPNAMAASGRAVYAGTLDRGLAVFERSASRWRWVSAGLPSMNVTAVAVQSGTVYVGTDNGLVRVREEVLAR